MSTEHDSESTMPAPLPPEVTDSESLQILIKLLDVLPYYVILVDEEHHILAANAAVRGATGLDPEQIVGQYCPAVIHGMDGPFPGCPLEEAVALGGQSVERELFDERMGLWLRSSVYPSALRTTSGGIVYLHTARDITEQKTNALSLAQSVDHHQSLANMLASVQGCRSSIELLETVVDQLVSTSWLDLDTRAAAFLAGDDELRMVVNHGMAPELEQTCALVPFGRCLCGKAAQTGEAVFSTCLDDDHEVRLDSMTEHGHAILPLIFEEQVLGVVNLYLRAGQAVEPAQADFLKAAASVAAVALSGMLAQERSQAAHKSVEASQRLSAIGQLAGGVAHDFNNVLTAISGNAELALLDLADGDPLRGSMEEILAAADRASAITRQLLAFAHKQVVKPEVVDLAELVGGMTSMLRRLIGEQVELKTSFGEGKATLFADPSHVEQILLNLAVNARDAMPDGGTLAIVTSRATLDEKTGARTWEVEPGEYVTLMVGDTGTGMDKDTLEHLFEPFFTTKAVGKGTGLGLATVYGIVRQYRGDISVESTPGEGTTFSIHLPFHERTGDTAPVEKPDLKRVPGGSETVLLAEDEPSVRALVRLVLERRGYTVLVAADAEEALRHYHGYEGTIDLLLTDVVMPGKSGVALAKRLVGEQPQLKVLYMSGYTDEELPRIDRKTKGTAFLEKPFTTKQLLATVRELLDTD